MTGGSQHAIAEPFSNTTPTSRTASTARIASLDILRGIAILMVLVVHAPWPDWILTGYAGQAIRLGAYGVDLFFVLSGYLISRILFAELKRTGTIKFKRFWLRRGFKIWPSYYVAYLLAVVVDRTFFGTAWDRLLAWPNFFFVQNYIGIPYRWFASWSLAVEEHFYTTLPLILLALVSIHKRINTLPAILLAVCVAVPWLRFNSESSGLIWIQTHLRMDALCWGVLLGYCEHKSIEWPFRLASEKFWISVAFTSLALAIVFAYPYAHKIAHTIGFTLVACSAVIWTAHAVREPDWTSGRRLLVRQSLNCIRKIGVYSYTIYLVQQLTKTLIDITKSEPITSPFMNSHGPQIAAFVLGSMFLGWTLSLAVEQPALRIRDTFVPR